VVIQYGLGIDLGTTQTAAAVRAEGRVEVVRLGARRPEIPSLVFVKPDGGLLIGDAAERRGQSEPARLAREFKRRIGDPVPILVGGSPFSAHALTAKLLRHVLDSVQQLQDGPPAAVTVTHPANWGPYKREQLDQAVRLADAGPVVLRTEPEAAALQHATARRIASGETVAVYDLGGGTFDAAVLRRDGDGFILLGEPEGIEQLGGIDFDEAVFGHVIGVLGSRAEGLDAEDPDAVTALARLRRDCVEAKEALSFDTEVMIPVALPGLHTRVRLNRSELESMIAPSLEDTVDAMRRALRSAQVNAPELSAVLLAGGSSRIPLVAQLLSTAFERPVVADPHPEHSIALGAAVATAAVVGGVSPFAAAVAPEPQRGGAASGGGAPAGVGGAADVGGAAAGVGAAGAAAGAAAVGRVVQSGTGPAVSPSAGPSAVGDGTNEPRITTPVVAGSAGRTQVQHPTGTAPAQPGNAQPGNAQPDPNNAAQQSPPGFVAAPFAPGRPIDYAPTPTGKAAAPGTPSPTGTTFGGTTFGGGGKGNSRKLIMIAAAAVTVLAAGTATAVAMSRSEDPEPKAGGPASAPASASAAAPAPPFPTDAMLARADQGDAFPASSYHIVRFTPGAAARTTLPDTEGHALPEWSNDRTRIATTKRDGDKASIWVRNADGSNPKKVVDDIAGRVAWSADDTKLAFMRRVGEVSQLFTITIGESEPRQITRSNTAKDDPAWSPDGSTIVYWVQVKGVPQLHLLSVDDPEEPGRQITSGDAGPGVDPAWSPDGKTIAYTHITGRDKSDIWLVDVDGDNAREFTDHPDREMDPTFSPDGTWIGLARGDLARPKITIVKADGSDERVLTSGNAREGHPGWS
jgi:actin-like ATPase involved in cell morphogenesis